MIRIMLETLLILAWGGFVIHANMDEQTVSAVAENLLNESSQSSSENITASYAGSNEKDFVSNFTQLPYGSSTTRLSTIKNVSYTPDSEKAKTESSALPEMPTAVNVTDDSHVKSSDLDYGGYKTTTELATNSEEIQKAELHKSEDKPELVIAETKNSDAGDVTTKTASIVTTSEKTEQTHSSSSSPSEKTTLESIYSSGTTIFSTDPDDESNMIEVTSSKSPEDNVKVSASPKSATKKRSLNSTDHISFNNGTSSTPSSENFSTGTHNSDLELTSTSSKLDSFDTTIKSSPKIENLEELPTPLPLEAEKKSNEAATSEVSLSLATSIVDSVKESKERKATYSSKSNSSMSSVNSLSYTGMESLTNANDLEASTFLADRDLVTVSPKVEEYDINSARPMSSKADDIAMHTEMAYSSMAPDGILSHEIDDIIYAGYADEDPLGVTFDPDGMKNDFPQDPDSIIFSVPPKDISFHESTYVAGTDTSTSFTLKNKNATSEEEIYSHLERDATKSSKPEILPHDVPETELATNPVESTSVTLNRDSISKSNHSETLVLPEVVFSKPASSSDATEVMLKDSPHSGNAHIAADEFVTTMTKTTPKKDYSHNSERDFLTFNDTNATMAPFIVVPETSDTKKANDFIVHSTEQSVIRPVKIASPADESTPSSVPPTVSSTLKLSITSSPSSTTFTNTGAMIKINSKSDTSSPATYPHPTPIVTMNPTESQEFSTLAIQHDIAAVSAENVTPFSHDEMENVTSNANATIAGVAVKTSVSVSLPLSKNTNSSEDILIPTINVNSNTSLSPMVNNNSTSLFNNDSSALEKSSVETTTVVPVTTTSGIKIRRPIIRVPGGTSSVRTRKPIISSFKRPSTTAGPPVSLFKDRTRINSITSSTTPRAIPQYSTIRIHYASRMPGLKPNGEMFVSVEPITTTVPPTTTTEEPISELPFTDQTIFPSLSDEKDVTIIKVGGGIVVENGLRWIDQLRNRHSPEYIERANQMHLHLERLFRSSPIASRVSRIEIDGFNGTKNSRSVEVDFILYLIKSADEIAMEHLARVFHEKLNPNNTFARYRVDPSRTAFEKLQEGPMYTTTPSFEEHEEPPVPQWAIAVIVICAASLIFIVLFAAVTMYGRHHMRRRYGNKLNEDDLDRSSGEWESKMTAAYENMAADTIYDADDLHGDTYKKSSRIATFHGIPSTLKRCDSWSSGGWSPKRKRPPHVH